MEDSLGSALKELQRKTWGDCMEESLESALRDICSEDTSECTPQLQLHAHSGVLEQTSCRHQGARRRGNLLGGGAATTRYCSTPDQTHRGPAQWTRTGYQPRPGADESRRPATGATGGPKRRQGTQDSTQQRQLNQPHSRKHIKRALRDICPGVPWWSSSGWVIGGAP